MARTVLAIAGGGTAGHVSPGLAVARAVMTRGVDPADIVWVGSRRGLETRLVPEAGLELLALPGRGIQRRPTPVNLVAVGGLLVAVVRALAAFVRRRPRIVLALGGYASVPGVVAAALLRVPVVLTEQNAAPSAANRLAARVARAGATPFPGVDLPRAVWTGNPVRPEILAVDRVRDRAEARVRLGIDPDRFLVVVMGGSLGARRINEALFAALPAWRDRGDLAIRHLAGARDHDDLSARMPVGADDAVQYQLVRYEDDMASVYAAADLVVARAGGNTVAELTVVGLPSVLVPLPGAPADHQRANAAALEQPGAAVVVDDGALDGARLRAVVEELWRDDDRRRTMALAAADLGRPDAADAIATLVCAHARPPIAEADHDRS